MTRISTRAPALSGSILVLVCAAALALAGCTGAPSAAPDATPTPSPAAKSVLVIGDSIPYNSPDDCPGCDGFVDTYALALSESRGEAYVGENRSRHDGARTADILEEVESGSLDDALSTAEIVVISVGFNDQPPYDGTRGRAPPRVWTSTPRRVRPRL